MSVQEQVLLSLLRSNFASFVHKVFLTINPGSKFLPNWHIDLIAAQLSCLHFLPNKRLIINIPPRSLKSVCVSVAWPAWLLGHNPGARIIVASYCEALSIKHSLDCKLVMSSKWYRAIFPKTILSKSQNTKRKFLTTENGFRLATSVGGYVTGEGADFLVIDDPHNPTYVNSDLIRSQAISWYGNTFVTRLNDPSTGSIVLVMQRLHKEDLSGYLLQQGGWQLIKIPALAKEDCKYEIAGRQTLFAKGASLNPRHFDEAYLHKLKNEIGEDTFAAQYQQEPTEHVKGLLDKKFVQYYQDLPSAWDYILQSWDTAVKVSEGSDFSVCTTWCVSGKRMYLVEFFRARLAYPDLKSTIESLNEKFSPQVVLLEDHSSGQSVAQDLMRSGMINLKTVKHRIDKFTRFALAVPSIRSGEVLFPQSREVEEVFLKELIDFPRSKHDDIVDSTSQAIAHVINSVPAQIRLRSLY